MKKMLFVLLLFIPVALFGQDVEPPTGWGDIIINPGKWVASFGAVSLVTAFIASFFIGLLKVDKRLVKQLIAWAVAIIILVVTDLVNFGYAAEFPVLLAVIHGFGAGLASNGFADVPLIKGMLDAIEKLLYPKK